MLVALALRLSWASIACALLLGTASIALGALNHSLAILGVGLNLAGDLSGSAVLIWRFRAERRGAQGAENAEPVARRVVAASLAVVAAFLTVQAARELSSGHGASAARGTVIVACVSIGVLAPLAVAKRRVATRLGSGPLRGDATLTGIGAAAALVALAGLLVTRALGWWWADPAAALVLALVGAAEARAVAAHT